MELAGAGIDAVQDMLRKPIKSAKKKFKSALKQGFSAASNAGNSLMDFLGDGESVKLMECLPLNSLHGCCQHGKA
eukprot:SAG31_NODE_2345_length_5903_cov_1.552895_9_plen_75_part_00